MGRFEFELSPVPPFRLGLTAWALRRRPDNLVDRWDGKKYSRTFAMAGRGIEVAVTQAGSAEKPSLHVYVSGPAVTVEEADRARSLIQKMLGTDRDLSGFYRVAERDPDVGELVKRFAGVKPPRLASTFEAVVNGITCQQISLAACIVFLSRLASRYGLEAVGEPGGGRAFPCPEDLAELEVKDFRALGFSGRKGEAIIGLSRRILDGSFDIDGVERLDDEAAVAQLVSLRGVGRWTAEFVLLRGLGRVHLFPGDDVGARRKLENLLALDEPLDYERARRLTSRWHPYAGFIYFHLLLNTLATSGELFGEEERYGAA